jgi:hypothetical protein
MKGYYLYIIIWAGGCIIASAITLLWNDAEKPAEVILFNENNIQLDVSKASGNIVSQLLMSAGELSISGTSLISPGNKRSNNADHLSDLQDQEDKERVYNTILKLRLEKANGNKETSGFSIKPVPEKN